MQQGGLPDFWMAGLQMGAMLCFVLALLFAVLYVARRLTGSKATAAGESINILCARHLGPKKQVILLEVLDRKILVGVGTEQITRLAVFKDTKDALRDSAAFSGHLEEQIKEKNK